MAEYEIERPDPNELRNYWDAAIGLQQVDDLVPSDYLLELSEKNIAGELNNHEIEQLLYKKYQTETSLEKTERKKESDIVTNRIAEFLGMKGQTLLTLDYFKSIHAYLFQDIYDHAGKFRQCNIRKEEPILNGDTVKYSNYFAIQSTLEYDFAEEKKKNYGMMNQHEIVKSIAAFTSAVWQVHPFMEGNTRTTALFIEQYLNGVGFNVENSLFKDHSQFFRNSLVRANYANYSRNITIDDRYLQIFFVNLLFEGTYKLQPNRLYVRECFDKSNGKISRNYKEQDKER